MLLHRSLIQARVDRTPFMPISISLNAPGGASIPREIIERGVQVALEREGYEDAEISITFLEDAPILDLNLRWLQHNWVPDVLSFPLRPPAREGQRAVAMGDIYVGLGQAERQADEHGVPYEEELLRLAIHGTLHILGYDHTDEEAAHGGGAHFQRQEELVREVLPATWAPKGHLEP
jgi:probable rRNA maturation factor